MHFRVVSKFSPPRFVPSEYHIPNPSARFVPNSLAGYDMDRPYLTPFLHSVLTLFAVYWCAAQQLVLARCYRPIQLV